MPETTTPTSYDFVTPDGQTIARELLIAYLNTGTDSTPVWSPIGKRVEDSTAEYDWQTNSAKDILGDTFNTMKKPIISQTFDPYDLDGGDVAAKKIWDNAVVNQDAAALANMDVLIAHLYAEFGERYNGSMIEVTGVGGEGGGFISMPIRITYGGTRVKGAVAISSGAVTFTPET